MKRILFFLFTGSIFLNACHQNDSNSIKENKDDDSLPDANRVELTIDKGPGADAFIANCQTCHTARYVTMQPKLSRKAWEKTVDKMIHVYGAKIDSLTASTIVNYLIERQR